MAPTEPAVSVIVPCFKQARFLADCLATLQSQSFSRWEMVVVDDGSPDDTLSVAEALMRQDSRVRLVQQPNGGTVVMALVGATMVGMTRVVFDDLHTNARRAEVQRRRYSPPIRTRAGDALGHFEFGSTVILVCSREAGTIEPLAVGQSVRMGARIGYPGREPSASS